MGMAGVVIIRDFSPKKKAPHFREGLSKKAATYSPTCVVPSALTGLTALFGMGRGEPRRYSHLKSWLQAPGLKRHTTGVTYKVTY